MEGASASGPQRLAALQSAVVARGDREAGSASAKGTDHTVSRA